MFWDDEFDFISIGGGIGGLSGAITASRLGARALVVEQSPKFGGVSALSLGMLWVAGNHVALAQDIEDRWEDGLSYVEWMGGGFGDAALARAWCASAPDVVRYFEREAGVRWRLFEQPDYYYPTGEKSRQSGRYLEVEPIDGFSLGEDRQITRTGANASRSMSERLGLSQYAESSADRRALGGGLAAYLMLAARREGVELLASVETLEVIMDAERVAGIVVRRAGKVMRFRATQGVLLATSGFDQNLEMAKFSDARLGHETLVPPSVRGRHLVLAGKLGAQVRSSVVRPQWVGVGFRPDGEADAEGMRPWTTFSFRSPHAIMVNRKGERFCDETWGPSYVSALSHVDPDGPWLKNQPCWAVFDATYREKYPIGSILPGDDLPTAIHSAASIWELAAKLGIDELGLQAEIERFNSDASEGRDKTFGRGERPQTHGYGDPSYPNPVLGPVEKAPFFGIRLSAASIGIPTMGLACDGSARVLDWEDRPIAGLYAAGNAMAMTDLGIGYNSGIANTRGMTFGHLAALDAVGGGRPQ